MKKKILIFAGMLALTPAASFANRSEAMPTAIAAPYDNITVKGTVVDETGSPIPGASVYVKGTTNGTISDIDGNFSLSCPSDATLVFSYVGYTTQEIADRIGYKTHSAVVKRIKKLGKMYQESSGLNFGF